MRPIDDELLAECWMQVARMRCNPGGTYEENRDFQRAISSSVWFGQKGDLERCMIANRRDKGKISG